MSSRASRRCTGSEGRSHSALVGLFLCAAALLPAGCPGNDAEEANIAPTGPPVAQIVLGGPDLMLRRAGKREYKPYNNAVDLARGTTVKTGVTSATLNFMGAVQVMVSPESELILQGEAAGPEGGRELVLGIKSGEVRANSSADLPLAIRMPHGELRGAQAFVNVQVSRDRDGAFFAEINAFSPNLLVENRHGRIIVPGWGTVRMIEDQAPVLVRQEALPRRGPR